MSATENNQIGTLDEHLRLGAGFAAADRPRTRVRSGTTESRKAPQVRLGCCQPRHDHLGRHDIEGGGAVGADVAPHKCCLSMPSPTGYALIAQGVSEQAFDAGTLVLECSANAYIGDSRVRC